MQATDSLLQPDRCALVLIDHEAGLAFGVESIAHQVLLNNTLALVRTALAFDVPIVMPPTTRRGRSSKGTVGGMGSG